MIFLFEENLMFRSQDTGSFFRGGGGGGEEAE